MSNSNFCAAKIRKNDEFYTRISDVENELRHYTELLNGKTILCNCNDGEDSAFWIYLSENFNQLGLKRLIAVKYGAAACGYVLKMERVNGVLLSGKTLLHGNGDFRNEESIALLKQADIVITNPPFTLFREYISLLTSMKKKYLVVGNMNALTFAEVFPYIKDNKMWLGRNSVKGFICPNGATKNFGNIVWFTNLKNMSSKPTLTLSEKYSPATYPHFDNYEGINVDRVAHIPTDYFGVMGVPISYISKHDPDQFKIIGITGQRNYDTAVQPIKVYVNPIQHGENGICSAGGKANDNATIILHDKPHDRVYYTADNAEGYLISKYSRVLIRRITA